MQQNVRPGRVYDADGRSVGVRYEVVDAANLITSNRDDLTINPDFPQELQPRDRTRALSQDQIAGIAANLQPERLGFSTDAGSGAPVVGPDGLVESGNGRVLALRRAFQQDGPQAQSYRNFLRAQNFDIEGIDNPVLIARRVTDLEDRVGFVTAANRSTAMKLGAAEQAIADGRLIDGPMLDRFEGGDVRAAGNAPFTREFMSKLPRAEQGSLIDKDGFLSQEGERRLTAALMGRAYSEPTLLGRTLEDTDNNIKAIGGALADAAGPWAKMRDAVARGEIPAGMDVTQDLMDAVSLVMRARDEGSTVSNLVNQAEMFGGPGELAKILARAMFSDADLKRPVGRARLSAFLRDFADEAMKNDAGPRLFGDALQASDILKSSLDRVGRQDLMRVAEDRLTPDAIERLENDLDVTEAAIMDAERLLADREEELGRQRAAQRRMEAEDAFHRDLPVRSLDDLYAMAEKWQASLDAAGRALQEEVGVRWKNPGIKSKETAAEKMVRKGYRDTRPMTDVVRGGFMVDTPAQADKVAEKLAQQFTILDEGWKTNIAGYVDRKILVKFEDGTVGEVQIWPQAILDAKSSGGHKLYEQMRQLPMNSPDYSRLLEKQVELYSAAALKLGSDWGLVISAGSGGKFGNRAANSFGPTSTPESITSSVRTRVQSSPSERTAQAASESESTAGRRSQFTSLNDIGGSYRNDISTDPADVNGVGEKIMVDLGDGMGERDLADILREADDEIAAGKEIEACTIGKATEE
ncbi:hypothetical protein [Rhizobium lentis]|uniref:hypothetical protein n=1 Tax=Rhizobium lentis TaxID=1138194 RepID=UPI0021809D8D|nr:hypothetical protein [Rhizobium lentis]